MRERPMLFNGPMVRAILDGRKTQTRRALKPEGAVDLVRLIGADNRATGEFGWCSSPSCITRHIRCLFGKPGDRLWVREAHAIFPTHGQHRADGQRWGPWGGLPTTLSEDGKQIAYYREGFDRCDPGRWRPSIHMPRWACRLVLEITDVRVERLQAISREDCIAEGAAGGHNSIPGYGYSATPHEHFQHIWNSTGGNWDSNPWVWVIRFKPVGCGDHG